MENINEDLSLLAIKEVTFNDLLADIFHFYIFQFLDLIDIYKLKLLSRNLNSIVDSYNVQELTIIDKWKCDAYRTKKDNWFSTTKSINLRNQIIISGLLNSVPKSLSNLKYLRLYNSSFNGLVHLNEFTKLQILELDLEQITFDYHLQLLNLKALSINVHLMRNNKLLIETPELRNLFIKFYYDTDKIEFKYRKSIKYLKTICYTQKVLEFRNLEHLEFDYHNGFDSGYLLMLIKLKKIEFNPLRIVAGNDLIYLKNLFKSKKKDVEFILNGVRIKEIDKI